MKFILDYPQKKIIMVLRNSHFMRERTDCMYQFTEDCLTGIEVIDDEHRQLFTVINEISRVLTDESKAAQEIIQSAKLLLLTLREYAVTHFAHEEAYMQDIHDPELPRQRKEHAEFTEKVNSVELDGISAGDGVRILQEMMEYLSLWLYRHILASDTLIGKVKTVHGDPVMLSFSDQYCTGVDLIDQEHRHLFHILADLNELRGEEFLHDKYDAIVDVLEEMKDYTVKHFQDEERYMESIRYEGLEVQRTVHQSFIDKMEDINLEDVDENQQEYIDELIDFLANWLINHIMKMDQKIPVSENV